MDFHVDQIDHVELTVPDRHEAANWYQTVLGLRIISEFKFWAEDPNGPLMIGTKNGGTKLALFAGEQTGSTHPSGFHLVAFRVGSKQFMNFIGRLPDLALRNEDDQIVTSAFVKDHDRAFSIYFCDMYGNQLELTTYEYDQTQAAIGQMNATRSREI